MNKSEFKICPISETGLMSFSSDWSGLLAESDANPLFMSWDWQLGWWRTWGKHFSLIPYFHAIYIDKKLVGVLPLYKLPHRRFGRTEIHFVGNMWGVAPTVRSEYIGPIFHSSYSNELQEFLSEWIRGHSWATCFVLPDYVKDLLCIKWSVLKKRECGYRVNVTNDFIKYKEQLSASSRLRIFNRAQFLDQHYQCVEYFDYPIDGGSLTIFFETLNHFHQLRWGKPCFSDLALKFHTSYLLSAKGVEPKLCGLKIDDVVVAVSYNLLVDDTLYNIQSGYLERFDKKVSLGLVHFGHLLEFAFKNKNIQFYDFLAGKGRAADYKASFHGETIVFNTYYIFTNPVALWIYSLKSFLKSVISLWSR